MYTKTRWHQTPATSNDVIFTPLNGGPSYGVSIPEWSFTDHYEIITPNSTGSHSEWKDFQHYKSVVKPSQSLDLNCDLRIYWPIPIDKYFLYRGFINGRGYGGSDGVLSAYGDLGQLTSGLPEFYHEVDDDGFVPPPSDLNSMKAAFLRKTLPLIKAELSSVNSIIELKDFKSLPEECRSILKLAGLIQQALKIRKHPISFLKRLKKLPLREIIRETASGYLQYEFNIAPLLSDIAAVQRAVSQYESRLNDLVTREGRVQTKHFMFRFKEFDDKYEVGDDNWFVVGFGYDSQNRYIEPRTRYQASRLVRYEPSTFHAQIEYNYNYTQYQLEHARVLALLDGLGINLNPAIVWNAIPWSFVVDWVVDVSRWLSTFANPWMKPLINIRRCLWSIKRQRTIVGSRHVSSSYDTSYDGPYTSLPSVHQTAYRRQVFLPGISSITTSGLDLKEVSLGAALVLSRRRHRHKPKG